MVVGALPCEGKAEQLRETTIVIVACRALAITLDPFRMLNEKRVMHLALKRKKSRSFR